MNLRKLLSIFLGLNFMVCSLEIFNIRAIDFDDISNKVVNTVKENKKPIIMTTAVGGTVFSYLLTKYIALSCIFNGSNYHYPTHDIEHNDYTLKYTEIYGSNGKLRGFVKKLKNTDGKQLDGKCVIVCSPKSDSAVAMMNRYKVLNYLLYQGATIIAIDYTNYGESDTILRLSMSEDVIYSDAERIYDYTKSQLHFASKDIIVFGHSLGGAIATHIAKYASNIGDSLAGIILASPIKNFHEGSKAQTRKTVGTSEFGDKVLETVAAWITNTKLDSVDNLRNVHDKNIPIFLCSGDNFGQYADIYSIKSNSMDKTIRELGFDNIFTHISQNCSHSKADMMFGFLTSLSGKFKRDVYHDYSNEADFKDFIHIAQSFKDYINQVASRK